MDAGQQLRNRSYRHTAWTRLVAIALCKTSGCLVLEVGLSGGSGGTTSADDDPHQHYEDDQRQAADCEHQRIN